MSSGLLDTEPEAKRFGERYNGRYHMPLLPGESGTKAGGNYVPGGVESATNRAGAFADSRELSLWEQRCMLMGLAEREELYERLAFVYGIAKLDPVRIDQRNLNATDEGKAFRADLDAIGAAARAAGGGSIGADKGTNRHDSWEARATTGHLIGTSKIRAQIEAVERLLEENGLVRVPQLQERVVRNVALNISGRIDDVLLSQRTGKLYMADLKTKPKPFYSWCETWIQQVQYATAEWMLDDARTGYIPGPVHHVDQMQSVLLRMPSDGRPPYLERVDLKIAYEWARIAKYIVDARSLGKSRALDALTVWKED